MAEGVLFELAGTVLEGFGKAAMEEAASWWGARDDLKKLEKTIRMIQARVRDAERHQEEDGSDAVKEWLRRLRMVLYQVDDLFDLVLTVDRQKQQIEVSKQVCVSFSRSGTLCFNWKISREIKSIRQQLYEINSDIAGLNLPAYGHRDEPQPPRARFMRNRETCSFVKAVDIIGRENDKNMIIERLLDPKYDDEKVTVIPIVGFGGIGKTTLAQLVFNDARVQKQFDLVTWVCVPEVDNQKAVMGKLYRCFTDEDSGDRSLNQIKLQIHDFIKCKKYLLVLDDMWDDSRDRWLELMSLLECGRIGSKVIVTTRSDNVAKVVGTVTKSYKLGFLTDDESWELFRSLAFKQNQEESNPNLTQIGKEIVGSCGNVPLAIRVVGSLLYSKDSEKEWQLFKDDQLSKAKLMEDGNLMPVLKLSYDYLPPALKQCFAYCSLFPKDYEFSKAGLVHLWMAQGYFEPSNRDIGDQYFMELLRMNFFQDPKEDGKGNVKTCKIHDLVHDLAQHIAGAENMLLGESSMQVTDELIHVSLNGWEAPLALLAAKNIRSLLGLSIERPASLEGLISRFQSLRVLSLNNIDTVPSSIGRFRHLRYLNLARNCIECLPNAITRLENLQTLNLDSCPFLKELPRDFAKLSNLRHLVINWDNLTDLPSGFGKMTTLHELHGFIVGKGKNTGIDSLPALNLRRELRIQFFKLRKNAVIEAQRATLKENQQLTSLILSFRGEETALDSDELKRMISCLQLPQKLKYLKVLGYKGDEMPIWWFDGLRKLVSISLVSCNNCRVLPYLRQLPHLKSLYLQSLNALEYVEDEGTNWVGGNSDSTAHNDYFPFLEVLELEDLPRLKEWTRSSNGEGEQRKELFPRLLQLKINGCNKLMSMPFAPKLESLEVHNINGRLFRSNLMSQQNDQEAPSSSSSSSSSILFTSLKRLKICETNDGLVFLSISSRLCNLETLEIRHCHKLWSLIFDSPNSIRHLLIYNCRSLRNISKGIHLPVLETLTIRNCQELEEEEEDEDEDEDEMTTRPDWQGLRSLHSLELSCIPKLEKIPRGITCLTMLQHLTITFLLNLTALPDEISNLSLLCELRIIKCPKLAALPSSLQGLTSLQKLYIRGCPDLGIRYEKPNGKDCHIIQHIPHTDISTGCELSFHDDLGFIELGRSDRGVQRMLSLV